MNLLVGVGALFGVGVLYGLSCDLRRWLHGPEPVRMSETITLENQRMETLRRQLDELWEDAEDARAVREFEAEARVWAEVAELEMLLALPAREPRSAL